MALRRKKGVQVRAKTEHLGGTRVRYTCPAGHVWTEDLGRPGLPVSKRLGETTVKLLTRQWGLGHAGVTIGCPACTAAAGAGQGRPQADVT